MISHKMVIALAGITVLVSSLQSQFRVVTPLIDAVQAQVGDETIRMVVEQGQDINGADEYGFTALHYAVTRPEGVRLIKVLIALGADVTKQAKNGDTAFIIAIKTADFQKVKSFIDALEIKRLSQLIALHRSKSSYFSTIPIDVSTFIIAPYLPVPELCEMLTIKDSEGLSPLFVARAKSAMLSRNATHFIPSRKAETALLDVATDWQIKDNIAKLIEQTLQKYCPGVSIQKQYEFGS